MTLNEQIIACAKSNGYNGKSKQAIRKNNKWCIYYTTNNPDGIFAWEINDEELKKWQRNYKLEKLI